MNIIKNIYTLFIITSLLFSDTDADISVSGTGTIPFCASWASATSVPNFSTVNIAAYDSDELIFTDIITISEMDVNYGFNITATKGGWTDLPSGYLGNKQANGSDSDFLIIVNTITEGYSPTSEGLAVANSHESYQTALTAGAIIATGGNTTHGVENAAFHIDGKVLLDWDTDIPGDYTLAITITVATQ